MSQRRKQSHRRGGPRGEAAQGKATLELWPFAFQDLVDQGRVIWLPDPDVRRLGDCLVVQVPHVGDIAIAAPVDAIVTAPARYGFILHEGASEWVLVIGTGANPSAARANALDELTRIWVEELGERAVERHCATQAVHYLDLRDTALTCLRLNPTELPSTA
jgi:hypothetical protein